MLENKKLNMILSLLIAIALWAFVIGEVNPEATRAYRDIPIQLINEEVLDEQGLAVYAVSDRTMSVTVTGTRSEVNQIDAKDIVATVDLSQAAIGDNPLRVDVRVPSKVEVENQTLNKVVVTVENEVSKEVPIRVRYNGSFNGEEEPITIAQSMESILVSGAETSIGRVNYVEAVVGENTVTEDETTFECRLVPVDENLSRVYNVELEVYTIEITAELAKTKTVPLNVPIVGQEGTGIKREMTIPETITLKGRSTDLEGITSIHAETIDISDVNKTSTIAIQPILPEGVEVSAETEKLEVAIQVTKLVSKSFDFTGDAVNLENLGDGLKASVDTKTIKVTVLGGQETIIDIQAENFALSADLSGLKAGKHKVKLNVQCTASDVEAECKPVEVVVNIKKQQVQPDPEPENDPESNTGDESGSQDEEQAGEEEGNDAESDQNVNEEENNNEESNE